jgi:hypothetical protein
MNYQTHSTEEIRLSQQLHRHWYDVYADRHFKKPYGELNKDERDFVDEIMELDSD